MKQIIQVVKANITTLNVDAIVNAANKTLLGGGGVDAEIHRVAGPELLEECKTLGGCRTGEAKLTKGYNLPCKYVIHTVGPIYFSEQNEPDALLASCYRSCMEIAANNGIKSIAFPAISTGAFSYPTQKAAAIAIHEIEMSMRVHPEIERVVLCCFDDYTTEVYLNLINQ